MKGLANADTVRVGETDLNIGGEGGGHRSDDTLPVSAETFYLPRDIGIARVLQHPSWNKKTLAHDIALLALASEVEFRPGVVPACMPDNYHGRYGEQGILLSVVKVLQNIIVRKITGILRHFCQTHHQPSLAGVLPLSGEALLAGSL